MGELFQLKHGYAFKGKYFSDDGPYIVLTPGNFFDEGGFKNKEQEKYCTGEVPKSLVLRRGDLIVAMTEQKYGLLGSSAIIPKDDFYLHNQRLGLVVDLNAQRLDRQFLYYLFNTFPVRAQIQATANGAKVRHTSPSRIYEVTVVLPPLPVQKRVVAILSAYNDLIENNQRRIKILEEMAQNLYREWFVKFRFPGHEQIPMVDSPLGKIPEGWEVRTVADTFIILGGGTPSKKVPEYWEGGNINWYSPTDLTSSGSMFMEQSGTRITELGLRKSSARLFPAFSVMMTSRATLGVISINTTEAATNQGFISCVPSNEVPLYTLYHWLKENVEYFISLGTGATFKEITKGVFKTIELAVPPKEISSQFEEMVGPLAQQVLNLQRRARNLRQTRDLLLPKLISGELDVSELDIAVLEDAA